MLTSLRSLVSRKGESKSARQRKERRAKSRLRFETLEGRQLLATMYDIQWLGHVGSGDNFSAAEGINDLGQVVGDSWVQDSSGIPGQEKAFSWTPGGGMVDLGTLNGNASYAWDVNNNGLVTGWYHYPVTQPGTTASGGYYEWAAMWNNGVASTIPGHDQIGGHSVAYDSNDSNVVVGHADGAGNGHSEAYTYDGTTFTFLGTLGGQWSYAMDINNGGTIAGFADTGENPSGQPGVYMSRYHASLWTPDGVIHDLGTLGTDSYAYEVNESGNAVGSSIAADGYYHAFLYDGTQMIDIGAPNMNTQALSINNAGQVVGDSVNWLQSSAFLYENGTTYDLGTLVNGLGADAITSAHDINNLGQIVGYGLHNGVYEAFVLNPAGLVPPTTPPTTPPTNTGGTTVSAPTDGFDGVTGQERTVVLGADGPLAANGFEFRVEWGDGTYDTLNGLSGISASHVYDVAASYTVTVTATDSDGQTGNPATAVLNIHEVEQQGDVLAIGGTSADDIITVAAGSTSGTVVTPQGTFTTNQVLVYGHKGSDLVVVQGTAGNDTFGIDSDSVDVNGVVVQGDAVDKWTADGLAGDDTFTAVANTLPANLLGNNGNDRFRIAAAAVLNGRVDGGAGTDTLDFAIFQSPATVDLQNQTATAIAGFAGIEGFVGSNLVDTLIAANGANTWTATGYDSGTVNAVQFQSFENWTGGSGDDTIKLASVGGLYGVLDGAGGVNTLDYSAFTTPVAVDLSAGSATTVNGSVANIDNVFGGAGADMLVGDAGDNILLGNAGDDVLDGGPGGNDVLVGGAGSDTLTGSSGRNILIGGLGADVLRGGSGDDLLIGATTSYDANVKSLTSLMAEWKRTDATYQQRIDHLMGTVSGGANGSVLLKSKSIKDDRAVDVMTGGDGADWFWGLAKEVSDRQTAERLN